MNKYIDISRAFGVYKSEMSDEKNIELLLKKIANLQASIEAPRSLKGYLKTEPDMDYLIDVIQRTTGHITCNPRPLTKQLMKDAYVLAIKE